jgi:hypothetical protein
VGNVLEIDAPPQWYELAQLVKHQQEVEEGIIWLLQARAKAELECCVGGPWDGQRHGYWPGKCICDREEPLRWIVYVVLDDWTAKFLGYATSQKKARKLAWENYVASRAK